MFSKIIGKKVTIVFITTTLNFRITLVSEVCIDKQCFVNQKMLLYNFVIVYFYIKKHLSFILFDPAAL